MPEKGEKPKIREEELQLERTGIYLILVSAIFSFYLFAFILANLFRSRWLIAGVLGVFLVLVLVNIVVARKPQNRVRLPTLLVVNCVIMALFSFWHGGIGGSGFIWGFVFAPLTFYIKGKRAGVIYSVIIIAGESILSMLAHLGITGYAFPVDMLLVLLSGFIVLVLFIYVYEQIRDQFEHAVDQKNTQLMTLNQDLLQLAHIDFLTELLNRRKIIGCLREEIDRFSRYRIPLSVILLDVDHFKNINDTYGHPFGDEVLRQISKVLRGSLRDLDKIGRFGGEEFLIVLPSTGADDALRLAERIRKQLRELAVRTKEGVEVPVAASFGVAEIGDAEDDSLLIARADRALYRSKTEGRDRVTRAE